MCHLGSVYLVSIYLTSTNIGGSFRFGNITTKDSMSNSEEYALIFSLLLRYYLPPDVMHFNTMVSPSR